MLKKIKTAKRRSVQGIKQRMGYADKTVDADYDTQSEQFRELQKQLLAIGSCTKRYLDATRVWTQASVDLAEQLHMFYRSDAIKEKSARELEQAQQFVSNQLRRSAAQVCSDQALGPLRDVCGSRVPEIERLMHERDGHITDYDSYRRRVNDLSKNARADPALLQRTQQKLENASQNYTRSNDALKQQIGRMVQQRADLVDGPLIALVATQAELLKEAHAKLAAVAATLPSDEVRHATRAMQDFVRQGGPPAAEPPVAPLTNGQGIESGKKNPMYGHRSVADGAVGGGRGSTAGGGLFNRRTGAMTSAPPSVGSVGVGGAAQAPSSKPLRSAVGTRARAEFDYVAQEHGELGFKVGDMITDISKDDSGWWQGRCNGKQGVFPSNYVKEL